MLKICFRSLLVKVNSRAETNTAMKKKACVVGKLILRTWKQAQRKML